MLSASARGPVAFSGEAPRPKADTSPTKSLRTKDDDTYEEMVTEKNWLNQHLEDVTAVSDVTANLDPNIRKVVVNKYSFSTNVVEPGIWLFTISDSTQISTTDPDGNIKNIPWPPQTVRETVKKTGVRPLDAETDTGLCIGQAFR